MSIAHGIQGNPTPTDPSPAATEKTTDEVLAAFKRQEVQQRIANTKIGCLLVVTLMPAGFILDYFVYPERVEEFFLARCVCSLLAGAIWGFLFTDWGRRSARWLGVIVPLLPVAFIAGMIAIEDGFVSPYYAGLNLVLLAVGFVLQWTFLESLFAVLMVFLFYLAAGFYSNTPTPQTVWVNNFYFITLMGVIVVVGTLFQSRQRLREFSLRFQLDQNREELEATNVKLRELGQIKDRFFANISHELRTPLTLLISPLEILRFQRQGVFDDEEKSLLATMHVNGLRLLKMINDLLDLVRLESGRMEVRREPIEVEAFVRGIHETAATMAHEKELQWITEVNPNAGSILADRDKLEKICLNLVFNAIKFTPKGGRVRLHAVKEQDTLVLQVSDTGVGIAAQSLPHIFDRFWQADSSSHRRFKGVGIGLSLVKELTELQGGTVLVESVAGQGTTFTVRLPDAPASAPATNTPAAQPTPDAVSRTDAPTPAPTPGEEWLTQLYRRAELFPTLSAARRPEGEPSSATAPDGSGRAPLAGTRPRYTALIADDEPAMIAFIRSQVEKQCRVLEAVNGQEAVDRATAELPDIILLDMNMPEKDGLQVCRELRQQEKTSKIPIILITARADEETKLTALSVGANDFLSKPFSVAELHVRIKNLLDAHFYQQELQQRNLALAETLNQLKETEIQLVQTEKLASLGRLSAGIIHEINNPLNFATTGLYTLREKRELLPATEQPDFGEVLHDVEEGLKRVQGIVGDLRAFTHPEGATNENVVLAETVELALRFLSKEWRGKVEMTIDVPPELVVRANRNKVVQVLLNLLQNSLDAVKDQHSALEGTKIAVRGVQTGEKVIVTVRDNGPGIRPENLSKVFDPFFTTKDVGEGLGLGLSICHRIMQSFGGTIRAHSQPGDMTEMTLEFPRCLTPESEPSPAME